MKAAIVTGAGVIEREVEAGARLDDAILAAGVLLDRPCGGRGACGKCRVEASGALSPATEPELRALGPAALAAGFRLACQARVLGPVQARPPAGAISTAKTFTTGIDLDTIPGPLGLALDLGTTTVAAFIVSLADGRVHAGRAVLNRQASFGAEVMSRLLAEERANGTLSGPAWASVKEAASGLALSPAARARVVKAVVVGNSAMDHLARGVPVATLLRSPFTPHRTDGGPAPIGTLTELFPALAGVEFPPLIGGFVGSDALACLTYFGLGRDGESALALDLGTNGEVLLAHGGEVWAASTAAGPAFEGVNIACGMRAEAGAITALTPGPDGGLRFDTIGNERPRGLAGSGLLSAVRRLVELGLIDASGRLDEGVAGGGLTVERAGTDKRVRLTGEVYLGQADVRELQKAKAAVRAAVEVLLDRAGTGAEGLERVILTGSFGGRLDPADALALGVIPPVAPGRLYALANGAGLGAAMLLDPELMASARVAARRVRHVELNLDPGFIDRYVSYMALQ
jgi:uncharacterized 2Fe-2S/4Fe-4S cluster protein (DUF4445 family)